MAIPLDRIANMPSYAPYYVMPPTRYRRMRAHTVLFRADPAAVDAVLPACLAPSDDGICAAVGIDAPWTSSYGAFQASLLFAKCHFEDTPGYFMVVEFLNSRSSIPAGREIWGTPKVWAEMRVWMDERVMITDSGLGGVSIFSIRSTLHRACEPTELPDLRPSWRLKVIPRADGPGADVLQLIDGSAAQQDVVTHVARAGDGVVEFRPSPVYDLSAFEPRAYLGAWYVESDHTETYGRIVRDFLRG
ncbi:MAG: acetoacetate decarboxylase family protein [Actinobacteria bacterium]|nr:acetoacetate decarboxylase family protein [Actinomycetota bacterium]